MKIERVRKRDGREVPFDQTKISSAIFRAARSAGGEDRRLADELAAVVVHFLEKFSTSPVPSIEEIQDMVEKVLIETGHARTAKAYILYRDRRDRLRVDLRVRRPRPLLDDEADAGGPWVASGRGDGVEPWAKSRIAESLERELSLPASAAGEIAAAVEERVLRSGLRCLKTSLIRELVEHELDERGLLGSSARSRQVGIPLLDFERLLFGGPAGAAAKRPEALGDAIVESLFRSYGAAYVFSSDVMRAHAEGRIRLSTFGDPFRLLAIDEEDEALARDDAPVVESRTRRRAPGRAAAGDAWSVVRLGRAEDDLAQLEKLTPGERVELRLRGDSFTSECRSLLVRALTIAGDLRVCFSPASEARGTVLAACAVSLPRAALRAASPSEAIPSGWPPQPSAHEELLAEFDAALELSVRAHAERRRFLTRLSSASPAFRSLVEASQDVVEPFGLRECVEFVAGKPLRSGSAADSLAGRVLLHLEARLRDLAERGGGRVRLGAELDPACGGVLARSDAVHFPWETGLMGSALRPPGGVYSSGSLPGALFQSEAGLSAALGTGILPIDFPAGRRPDPEGLADHLLRTAAVTSRRWEWAERSAEPVRKADHFPQENRERPADN